LVSSGRRGRQRADACPALTWSQPCTRLIDPQLADRVESAYGRQVRVFALDVRERENPLYALDDLPTKALSELRGVLLQEHEGRVRDWTRLAGGDWHRRLARFGCTRASDGSTIDGRGRNKGLRWGGRGGKPPRRRRTLRPPSVPMRRVIV